ncbi:hypothetical protein RHMOL_Rhmol03G0014600 [Rhododendron molle]|uniref:Uncharacterized protein n=1 Tax=Rhododendron molle TaxID=49168 RepID=A0ACC0P950_RHOML|nr:hypothetical protein RHMOL_Rhmol03G0014600 [Rhododendron molle]
MCTPQGIIEKVGCLVFDEAVKAAIERGKYVIDYKTNLKELQVEIRKLEGRREIIQRKVREAKDDGKLIYIAVSDWLEHADTVTREVHDQQLVGQTEADRMTPDVEEQLVGQTEVDGARRDVQEQLVGQTEADGVTRDVQEQLVGQSSDTGNMSCFKWSCPNIKRRYQLSKEAKEKIADVKKLIEESHFNENEISYSRPPPSELEFPSNENYVDLDSRTPVFERIVDALKDPSVNVIGVHGLGGVGKTTLVEEVGKKMRHDGTFKQVALAVVSKDLNVQKIQSQLADSLDFKWDANSDDQKGRAKQLWHKFTNGERFLIILDDVWTKVDIKAIGIPLIKGSTTGCKVVLTSRNENLLVNRMNVDKPFPIAELKEQEAWTLFNKKLGDSIKSQPELCSLAYKVCKKCNGLPIAINALGEALKGKEEHAWKTALAQLEKYMLTEIEDIDPSVWASLKLSYEMLWSSNAKSCFLLCCLFHEDVEISIDDLMRHCVARSLLSPNPRTLEEARNAVRTSILSLKSASLLSNGDDENVVRIHDVIRDVGISIAREKEAFLVDHGADRWPRNPINGPSYKAMSLSFKNIKGLQDGLVYPQLETLMVANSELSDLEFPDNFFNGMMQLTVLTFTRMRMRRLPSSLAKLTNLRMLYLNECELDDIAILKDLKSNLEVLSLRGSRIKALPPQIGQLTGLRVLDLQDCDKLMVIPRGVISDLTSLEELYFPKYFDKWEATTDKQQDTSNGENVSLEELKGLLSTGQLTTLRIYIPDVMVLPNEDLIFANLKGFKILVGFEFEPLEKISGRCMLKLEGIQLRNEFIPLVDKAEVVVLREIEGLKKVFHDRGVGNRFLDLKYLKVISCVEDLEYLFGEPKSFVQSQGLHCLPPFNNLTVLIIKYCKSKYLFSPTTARGFVHLEKLEVTSCKIMKGIVGFKGRNDEDEITSEVKFSKLKQLELVDLPNLLSFYAQKEKMGTTMGSSSACAQPLFSEKVIFPVLESLTIERLDNIIAIWDKQSIAILQEQGSFCQLTNLRVRDCSKLMHVFSSNMHPLLKNLEKLEVKSCGTMKGIAEFEGERDEDGHRNEVVASLALEVEHLETVGVPKIKEIRDKQPLPEPKKEVESLCKLMDIRIENCGRLLYVFPSHMLPQNLQGLVIFDCGELEVIFSKDPKEKEAINNDIIMFPQLNLMALGDLRKLKSFYTETQGSFFSHEVVFPVLKRMDFTNLDKITRIWDDQPLSEPEKEAKSFSKLENIIVGRCDQLEYVLPSYMLPQLKNTLQELRIWHCTKVEVIISNNPKEKEATNNNDTIRFPQLKTLLLRELHNLKSFICSDETQSIFSNKVQIKVVFPVLKRMNFGYLDKITRIWDDQPLSEPEKGAKSFSKLENIIVFGCHQLEYVLPSYMLPQLKNLQELRIESCTKVEVIISNNPKEKEATNNNDTIRFPQLETLTLSSLPNLKSFICSETQLFFSNKDAFPVLQKPYHLDQLFELLRNKTSTKEECGTSGKESDYNGEELDEDLETPTKEVAFPVLETLNLDKITSSPSSEKTVPGVEASTTHIPYIAIDSPPESMSTEHEVMSVPGVEVSTTVSSETGHQLAEIAVNEKEGKWNEYGQIDKPIMSLPTSTEGLMNLELLILPPAQASEKTVPGVEASTTHIPCIAIDSPPESMSTEHEAVMSVPGVEVSTTVSSETGHPLAEIAINENEGEWNESGQIDRAIMSITTSTEGLMKLELFILPTARSSEKTVMHKIVEDGSFSLRESDYSVLSRKNENLEEPVQSEENEGKNFNGEQNGTNISFPKDYVLAMCNAELREPPAEEKWWRPSLILLTNNKLSSLPDKPDCPNLQGLFLQNNTRLRRIPSSFFDNMPKLQFLDMSKTGVRKLPASLSKLSELKALFLRDCDNIDELQVEIGNLERIEVLDLWGTQLLNLPDVIAKLSHLRLLRVSFYGADDDLEYPILHPLLVSRGIISKLRALQALSIAVRPGDGRWNKSADDITDDVASLGELTYLQFYFPEVKFLALFMQKSLSWRQGLLRKFKFVLGQDIERIVSRVPDDIISEYEKHDRCLRFVNGDEKIPQELEELLVRITAFYLDHHCTVKSLSEFGLTNLKELKFCVLRECPSIVNIINNIKKTNGLLPHLEHLSMHYLPRLEKIWKGVVPLGSLDKLKLLSVRKCPKLKFILTESMLQCLSKLEELIVEDCESVKVIIETKGKRVKTDTILPSLKKMKLSYLPKLGMLWNGVKAEPQLSLSSSAIHAKAFASRLSGISSLKRYSYNWRLSTAAVILPVCWCFYIVVAAILGAVYATFFLVVIMEYVIAFCWIDMLLLL